MLQGVLQSKFREGFSHLQKIVLLEENSDLFMHCFVPGLGFRNDPLEIRIIPEVIE